MNNHVKENRIFKKPLANLTQTNSESPEKEKKCELAKEKTNKRRQAKERKQNRQGKEIKQRKLPDKDNLWYYGWIEIQIQKKPPNYKYQC